MDMATRSADRGHGPDVPPEAGHGQVDDGSHSQGMEGRETAHGALDRVGLVPLGSWRGSSSSSGSRTNTCSCIRVIPRSSGSTRPEVCLDRLTTSQLMHGPDRLTRPASTASTARRVATSAATCGSDAHRGPHRRAIAGGSPRVGTQRSPERRHATRRAGQLRSHPGNQEWPVQPLVRRPSRPCPGPGIVDRRRCPRCC